MYGELVRRFPPGRVHVSTVAAPASNGDETTETLALMPGVEITRMPFTFRAARRPLTRIRWARWCAREVRRGEVALLHVGNIRPTGYIAAWLSLRLGIPYLVYVHGLDVRREMRKAHRSTFKRLTGRTILARSGLVIANSEHTADATRRLMGELGIEERGRVVVVHPGTDPDRFRPRPGGVGVARERFAPGADPVVLTVARLVPRKGIDTALEAVARLTADFPRLAYLVAGTGPERARLQRLAETLGIAPHVRFLGDVPEADLPDLYAAADVFVLLAREIPEDDEVEGFGIVYCEAGASGLPVVGASSGGVPEAVRDAETGILVRPADPDEAARALRRLFDDAALRRAMGDAGRRLVEREHNWDRAAHRVWDLGQRLAGG